jgi:hypothetical protein
MSKRKILITITIVITLIIVCCLLAGLPSVSLPTDVQQSEFQPKERSLSTTHYVVDIRSSYWEKQKAHQVTLNPIGIRTVEDQGLILKVTITNPQPQQLNLVCYMKDVEGYEYLPSCDADSGEMGCALLMSLSPLQSKRGQLAFSSPPPNLGPELWFHCGLCDNSFYCVRGKLYDAAIQIR